MQHPEIAAQLEKLWQSANTDTRDAVIDKEEYKAAFMSDRLYTAYGFDPKEREKKDDDGGGKDDKKGGKEEKGEEKPETTQSL